MKKIVYNLHTITKRSTGLWISFTTRGVISVSHELGAHLKLDKNKINFIQDEDKPSDWYLQVTTETSAFQLGRYLKKDRSIASYKMCSKFIANKLIELFGINTKGGLRVPVSKQETEKGLYAIITNYKNG